MPGAIQLDRVLRLMPDTWVCSDTLSGRDARVLLRGIGWLGSRGNTLDPDGVERIVSFCP
jgi:hypothetical protein